MQVKELLEQRFPGMEVLGSNYPISPFKATLSKLATAVQYSIIGIMLVGDRLLPALGFPQLPELYVQLRDKKMAVILGAWFIGNMVQNSLTSSGAFEIYYDGQKIFSKLDTGRVPAVMEILNTIETLQAR